MQLWTDYEGVTIDGAYPLQKLLMPEGRSAFYSATGPDGELKVVRLIECHFDEDDILARWRSVEALNHPNFLKFEHFGQTEIDDRPVVYAVLEKVDANLAEVLDRGTLSQDDVTQLGLSLVAALDVLHTHGFIHEHVEPRNIFALKDTVKLRSDCIREAPEGEEGRAAKQRDVRDLVNVLLQGLTQQESLLGFSDSELPKPFHPIIRKGLDATWGLEDIRAALEGHSGSKQPASPVLESGTPAATVGLEQKAPNPTLNRSIAAAQLPTSGDELNFASIRANARKQTGNTETRNQDRSFLLSSRWLGIYSVVALLVIAFLWARAHTGEANRHDATKAAALSQLAGQPSTQTTQQSSTGVAAQPDARNVSPASIPVSAGHRAGWRVIAFTYNRRTDAEKKVSSLARIHPDLIPAVFSTNGQSPYLVSVGGVMDQHAASALAHRSRALGLPRDTFAMNYSH